MRQETIHSDITVVGGGLAGVNAAVAAARLGRTVSLIQNRPVLGGNSSSEVRVWVCGATSHGMQRFSRETGIMGELFVENQFRNPEGNPYFWDLVVLEAVKAEPNIQLFLNTDVHEVGASGDANDRHIDSVTGWMMGSERRITFKSEIFLDCTGDGLVGFLAGAKYRLGREARDEYDEVWAPEAADEITLGSTILFYSKDAGHPVKYVAPSFAKDITQTSIPMKRVIRSGDSGCHYWWIEFGGELDTVHDNEAIRDELWSVIYGIWDYIKNSGQFDSENMTLEWVGSVPGKREFRRFVGDYVLSQNDIMNQEEFHDRIAFGGWSIDLHPPQGMYSAEKGSKHLYMKGNYHIPYRSLYSKNVSNLMFAGRNISATHVAFGTTRVMATCAIIGEAAGTGAALAVQYGTTPRGVYEQHLDQLHQTLLKQDASVIGIRNDDSADVARLAAVQASSTLTQLAVEHYNGQRPLQQDNGLLIPVDPELAVIELLIDASADTSLQLELWSTDRKQNYVPQNLEVRGETAVSAGEKQWVKVSLAWKPDEAQNAMIVIKANPLVTLYMTDRYQFGVLVFKNVSGDEPIYMDGYHDLISQWQTGGGSRRSVTFRSWPETQAYAPEKILDGYIRPFGGPHLWSSDEITAGEEVYLQLDWNDRPVSIREVQLTFNDDVNEDLINLHHHRTPFETIPELVRDYRLEANVNGEWLVLHQERGNRKRKRVHRLNTVVEGATSLRLVIEATNGALHAQITEIRVYEQ
ncbi:FAD-dependent oxidoreductase [Paenibacillus sp. strain BS8-2]